MSQQAPSRFDTLRPVKGIQEKVLTESELDAMYNLELTSRIYRIIDELNAIDTDWCNEIGDGIQKMAQWTLNNRLNLTLDQREREWRMEVNLRLNEIIEESRK